MTVAMRFKLIYALLFAGVGIFYIYLALYFKRVGLSGTQVGILLGVLPLASFLTQPLWGMLSDVYQLRRAVLSGTCFGLALVALLFLVSDSFVSLFVATLALAVIRSPVSPLCDALALDFLEQHPGRYHYGGLRLWGSVGYAVASFAVGALVIDLDIRLIIYLYGIVMFLMGLVTLSLPDARQHSRVTWRDGVALLGSNPALAKFLLGALLVGMTVGIVNSYLIIYLDDLGAAGWLSGSIFAISGLLEVPLMANAAVFIRRWGLRVVMLGGSALLLPRWLLYTVISEPLLVLPTQILHSIGMLSLLVAAVLFVDQLLTPQWRATGQTLYQAVIFGIGSSIGLFGAGIVYEYAGIVAVWWMCFVAGTLGLGVFVWATRAVPAGTPDTDSLAQTSQEERMLP